ncbi:shikimate dehydrogenase [Prosthecodimorpha staleyi]|uniref:Shikimate dehydrogenase (NADP(+)) n=1 Tax=Prosthecodimorpha staleyi TaxID=2840188 RepID=A0A947D4U3_9HYPH|nr:shikimate dehydrogenase [Prosthecodimorpha staleyi]MBT9290851.1 shikimate dehydrogenase [Prosthecodimorpha staleyi]
MTAVTAPAVSPPAAGRFGARACVIGWPVDHARSPLIHGYWLDRTGLDGTYERVAVAPNEIHAFLERFPESGYAGGNVTVPHKEAALAACDEVEPVARAIGAVNTLWVDGGKLYGTNTDALGFLANLDETAPGWDKEPGPALVLGAGGAARAVVWALIQRGFRPKIANRNVARAEDLVRTFGGGSEAYPWEARQALLWDARILVNTTSLGMKGIGDIGLDLRGARGDALITDIVYVPLVTDLLDLATSWGLRTVDGLGMLLHQAVPGFERWFGLRPSVDAGLRARIVADIEGRAL